jgi:bifunctional non-homologous end joining protein LigD
MKPPVTKLELDGHEVTVSNPAKLYFPDAGITKLDLIRYYLAVADGAIRGVARRPMVLKRFVNGIGAEPFFQKRVAEKRPAFIETATFHYPSGRSAEEIVVNHRAALAYVVNLGCIDLNPHAVRADDLDRPDELRIDLDPVPGVAWAQMLEVAGVVKTVLDDFALIGWPKTSGSRGIHIWVRISPEWPFTQVRRAGLALAREVERRAPAIATSKWQKEDRHGVLIDYNQNARDRTTCSAYSVRPTPDARVSMPLGWDQLLACDPHAYTLRTVPALFAEHGDAHAGIDEAVCRLEPLLALADQQEPEVKAAKKAKSKLPKTPVITIAQAKEKTDVLAGLERWKAKYPAVVPLLAPEHVIVDTNRGRATAWYRVRINLTNVPEEQRPPPAPPDPDYDVKSEWADWLAASAATDDRDQ